MKTPEKDKISSWKYRKDTPENLSKTIMVAQRGNYKVAFVSVISTGTF
jgi:hypothetical protein